MGLFQALRGILAEDGFRNNLNVAANRINYEKRKIRDGTILQSFLLHVAL